jgi:YbbR domain-containing protein
VRWLRHNFAVKLAAVAGSVLLFAWVRFQEQSSRDLRVPVEVRTAPNLQVILPEKARRTAIVTVSGPADVLDQLEPSDVHVYIEARDIPLGEERHERLLVELPRRRRQSVIVTSIEPALLPVRVDISTAQPFPVQPNLSAIPRPSGYAWTSVRVDPPTVHVAGYSSDVGKVARVEAVVTERPREDNLEALVQPRFLDRSGRVIGGQLVASPALVRVRGSLQRSLWSKPVMVVPRFSLPPAPYRVSQLQIDPPTVTLTGPSRSISTLGFLETEPVRLPGRAETVHRTIALRVPRGATAITPPTVTVTAEIVSDAPPPVPESPAGDAAAEGSSGQ